jgi:hypothetical protein
MPKEKEPEKPPGWITTMSDMNTLLMVFFIMLFSMLAREPNAVKRTGKELNPIGIEGGQMGRQVVHIPVGQVRRLVEVFLDARSAQTTVVQIEGVRIEGCKRPEGVVLTIGGEFEPFDEGSARLTLQHAAVLKLIYEAIRDRPNRIAVRGSTAANWADSVVNDGGAWRPWREGDDPGSADWRTLGFLRARAAARALTQPRPGGAPIGPERLVVESAGAWGERRGRTLPGLMREGGSVERREGEMLPEALLRLKRQEWAKDRRVDVIVLEDVVRP